MSITDMTDQHKPENLEIPKPGEDPAERKRVLNVLAQRRYRQRKKDHLRKLEKQAKDNKKSEEIGSGASSITSPATINLTSFNTNTFDSLQNDVDWFPTQEIPTSELDPSYLTCNTFEGWDPSTLFPIPTLPSSPSDPYITSSSDSPDSATSQSTQGSTALQQNEPLSFPDEIHLPMLELNLLRGALTIAKRLNVDSLIWNLDSNSPFNRDSLLPISYDHLPLNLRPTLAQIQHPHHPVIDIMPWPSVRDRLILIFSQPQDLRPPIAASPTALVDFIYDIEDPAEGVRIWGDDPCSENNWEVGQKVFSRWWWAFESAIIQQSNRMRNQRGAIALGMHGSNTSTVLEEIE